MSMGRLTIPHSRVVQRLAGEHSEGSDSEKSDRIHAAGVGRTLATQNAMQQQAAHSAKERALARAFAPDFEMTLVDLVPEVTNP